MRLLCVLLILGLTSCKSITTCFLVESVDDGPVIEDTKLIRSLEYQKEIDDLLAIDAENKKWEKIFLKEIAAAQKHDDYGAYQFFLEEYLNVPRLRLPEWMKDEPGYVPGVTMEYINTLR